MWGLGCVVSELTYLTAMCSEVENRDKIIFIDKEQDRLSELNQKGSINSTDDQSIKTISAHLTTILEIIG